VVYLVVEQVVTSMVVMAQTQTKMVEVHLILVMVEVELSHKVAIHGVVVTAQVDL
jgi:hypothetical protein